ncbi:MAG TPA: S41 family peptidase [Candidatus Kapabacteria bacterium]|jgi:carboxyl-terminal processing protease|nr:S41 family peptidase [Candidatus Kapabacteria bacterium]HOV93121.1 S41 family peptidase [Candidatus Kapabacteria bacterium]
MQKKHFLNIGLVALGLILGLLIEPVISSDNIYDQIKKLQEVLSTVVKNYVDPVDTQKISEAAIKGMLNELDPHSVYITAEEMKQVDEDFQGSFEGIGVQFDIINDTIVVISAIAGGPSENVGIQAGDKIVKIDNVNAIGISNDDVRKKLRGAKGTKVSVDIKRGTNPELLHFEIIRDKIPLYTVDASFMIDSTDIGVIVVNRFAATTHDELMEATQKLYQKGMKKLILDLRGNPGGYLNQAVAMADEFLAGGDTIVYTKGRRPEFDELYVSTAGGILENIPLIVMINEGSASASEIVSGSIQDLDRGLIVGETSFGKGLVQRQYPLSDGSAFRLTIARYYTPSGRSIQRPYKDKSEYRALVGRIELKEGSNIGTALEMVKKEISEENARKIKEGKKNEIINIDSIPIYYTRSGRVVLGGGGIIPDYIVRPDTLTNLTVDLRRNRIFYEFFDQYLNNGKEIKEKYGDNFTNYLHTWNPTPKMMNDFKKFAEDKKIKWNDSLYAIDKDFIATELKATIAQSLWNRESSYMIYYKEDKQINTAKNLFNEAIKIAQKKSK